MLGESLRKARESAGLSIEDVAAKIRDQEESGGKEDLPKLSSYVQWVSRQERGVTVDPRDRHRFEIWLRVLGMDVPQAEAALLVVATALDSIASELAGIKTRVEQFELVLDHASQERATLETRIGRVEALLENGGEATEATS